MLNKNPWSLTLATFREWQLTQYPVNLRKWSVLIIWIQIMDNLRFEVQNIYKMYVTEVLDQPCIYISYTRGLMGYNITHTKVSIYSTLWIISIFVHVCINGQQWNHPFMTCFPTDANTNCLGLLLFKSLYNIVFSPLMMSGMVVIT